jgi:hypothetical protein
LPDKLRDQSLRQLQLRVRRIIAVREEGWKNFLCDEAVHLDNLVADNSDNINDFAARNMSKNKIFALVYAFIGLSVILTPLYICPVCPMATMHCRAVTLPALIVIGVVTIIIAGGQYFTE